MKNNLKCLIVANHKFIDQVATDLNISSGLLRSFYDNPNVQIPLDVAYRLADYFKVHVKFVLGLPFKREISVDEIRSDYQTDIQNASSEERLYLEYRYCKGYYSDSTSAPEGYNGTAFIAMSFDFLKNPNLCTIRDAFKAGIEQAGFLPVIASEIQTNDYITHTIMSEIKKCAFLVLDTTYENYGAYYEAGYAKGLGKEVIICCRRSKFDRQKDHFDINQINHVLWDEEDQLSTLLTERICTTVQ